MSSQDVTTRVAHVGQHRRTRSLRQVRQARFARHVFRGVTTAWTAEDGHVHLIFSTSFPWHLYKPRAQKTTLVHACTTASSSSAMLEQGQRDTHDNNDTSKHVTSRHGTPINQSIDNFFLAPKIWPERWPT